MTTVPIKMNSINIDVSQKHTKVNSKIYDVIVDDEYSDIDFKNNEVKSQDNSSELIDVLAKAGATAAVGVTSVLSGVLKFGENITDFKTWLNGTVLSGVVRLFGNEELAIQIEQQTMDEIAYDTIGEFNKFIYEETKPGKWLDDNSYMKYDSNVANKIQEWIEKTTLAVVATAVTGPAGLAGSVAAFSVGFAVGTGGKAEQRFQNVENRNFWKDSLSIGSAGVIQGIKSAIQGKIGQSALKTGSFVKDVGLREAKSFFKANFGSMLGQAVKKTVTSDIGYFIESGITVAKNAFSWVQNKEVTLKDVGRLGVDLGLVFGANLFQNFVGEGFELPQKYTKEKLAQLSDDEISALISTTKNQHQIFENIDSNRIKNSEILSLEKQLVDDAQTQGMTLKSLGGKKSEGIIDPLLQKKADDLAKKVNLKAEIAEPKISIDIRQLETDNASLVGFDHRLKSRDSLARKILTDTQFKKDINVAAEEIGDSVRYTLIVDELNYKNQLQTSLDSLTEKGYKIKNVKNKWGDPIYQGVNTSIVSPDGITFELQFHTNSSFNTKETLNHLYYEIARNDYVTNDQRNLANKIMVINQSKVIVPDGMIGYEYKK